MHIDYRKKYRFIIAAALLIGVLTVFAACSGDSGGSVSETPDAFSGREASDVSGYEGMKNYDKDIMFVDTTVAEVAEMMDKGDTFAVFASFDNCPWCNLIIPYLNDAAIDAGVHIGYINTRLKPEWSNNMDIDDYDLFVEKFGDWLSEDDDGKLHLYTPDLYFIKNGKVAAHHDGVTPGVEDPSSGLTPEQEEKLRSDLKDEFASLK